MTTDNEIKGTPSVLIVGGKGKMGSLFADLLRGHEWRVSVLDLPDPITADRVGSSDIVILSVPLGKLESVCKEVLPLVRPGALLCDFGSLKAKVCAHYATRRDIETVGLHPMFGPHVSSLERQRVLVCPVNPGPRFSEFASLLAGSKLVIREMSADEHDKMMAYIQVAVHFTKVVLGKVFAESSLPCESTLASASPVYEMELVMLSRLFSQDPQLYEAIQMNNEYAPAVRQSIAVAAAVLNDDLSAGDPRSFRDAFEASSRYFSDFARDSLKRSS